ncbi:MULTISPECIES: hypothetical protein [unclassified Rhizobacter]|uniref:hypothetical protein n=1 Tax=unclassified Rhizobacter TaxID=2640088 RepID=UPI0006F8A1A5|nr:MULTISPECIES: hypothetical protein [unclassified Rhizobacter]KQU69104.1 hypothetical protein ASC88_28630 [Rhizobacter sp. Root29]KQW03908.1 hypothetical protein ASC98_26800 [Rhizobacter sp. Root1238]KRB21547.1 hypothetical protein ASE08_21475 [Rhizobacter sp. Root16D2]
MHIARPAGNLPTPALPKAAANPPAAAPGGFGSSLKPAATSAAAPDASEPAPAAASHAPPKPDLASQLSTLSLAATTTPRPAA